MTGAEEEAINNFQAMLQALVRKIGETLGDELCSQSFMMITLDVAEMPDAEKQRLLDIAVKSEAKQLRANIRELMKTESFPVLLRKLMKEIDDEDSKNQEDPKADEDPKAQVNETSPDSFG